MNRFTDEIKNSCPCSLCKNHIKFTITCRAFPKGIPEVIITGDNDHTKPYPGDNGIRFEKKDLYEQVQKEDKEKIA